MSAPHEAGWPRDSLVRAQFAPDVRRAEPEEAAELQLVLDNADTVTRLVRVELAGPLARYTRPRTQPRLELAARRQWTGDIAVRPKKMQPEGGHHYDLHAQVIDEKSGELLFTTSARIMVVAAPDIYAKPLRATPDVAGSETHVQLMVRVQNAGNVPLRMDAQRVNEEHWIRDDERNRDVRMKAVRRAVLRDKAEPRTPELLRPGQRHDFEVHVKAPRYLVGIRPRRWWVPVGVRGEDVDPECVFVDFVQQPRFPVEQRMVWLAGAVVAALLVLVVFMAILAT
jgi:hypothetical protein